MKMKSGVAENKKEEKISLIIQIRLFHTSSHHDINLEQVDQASPGALKAC
jgi:hypothetical protein